MAIPNRLSGLFHVLILTLIISVAPIGFSGDFPGSSAVLADDDDDDDGGDDDDDDDDDDGRRAPARSDYVPNEILLIDPSEDTLARSTTLGFSRYATEQIAGGEITIVRLRLPPGLDAPAALALLRADAPDQTADLNHTYRLQQASRSGADLYTDCRSSRCYPQAMIGWTEELASCAAGLRIGVLDTRVNTSHSTLRGQAVRAVSFASPLARPSTASHGTGIVALLAARADSRVPGLLPDASVFAADVFHADDAGRLSADAVTIARGIGWLIEQDVDVVNISFSGDANILVAKAIKRAQDAGLVFAAAAGNEGPRAEPRYPAALPSVIAVTAVDRIQRIYRRASQGEHIAYAAPGVNVWTARSVRGHGPATGTSYATPFVTAVLAVLGDGAKRPGQPSTIDLGPPGRDTVFGEGLIQAPERCSTEASAEITPQG